MHVAMVSEHASPLAVLGGVDAGGQNVHVAALATALADLGAGVTVYTRRDDPAFPRRVAFRRRVIVEHVDAGPPIPIAKDGLLPYMDEFAVRLRRAWRRKRPDVIHAHFWMSGRAALAAARPLGIPVVQTFHALGVVKRRHQGAKDTSPSERLAEETAILERSAGVIATCHDEVRELEALGGDRQRITVVPCGIDLERFRPDGPAEPRGTRRRLAVVGRLVERKGIADVVAALRDLPDTEVVVAGGPRGEALDTDAEARRLLDLATSLGVADRVALRGGIDQEDVPALLRSADVAISVPWYEPFGIAPVEAMACGVPVVVTAVGGMLDTVVHGTTGVHVPPQCPDRLASAVRTLLDDAHRRARMGAAGAVRVHAGYGWPRVARATLDAYRTLARTPGRRAPEPGVRAGGRSGHRGLRTALAVVREPQHEVDRHGE